MIKKLDALLFGAASKSSDDQNIRCDKSNDYNPQPDEIISLQILKRRSGYFVEEEYEITKDNDDGNTEE
jgi:hypothetical protein